MSKLLIFDFLCSKHGLFEELVNPHVYEAPCPRCKTNALRQISAVHIDRLGMATQSGATPTSIDHFERLHNQRRAIEDKRHREHGDYGTMPGSDGGSGYPVITDPV